MVFELWREDDNGQRFLVESFIALDAAEKRMAELTRIQHKQIYWISKRAESPVRKDSR